MDKAISFWLTSINIITKKKRINIIYLSSIVYIIYTI